MRRRWEEAITDPESNIDDHYLREEILYKQAEQELYQEEVNDQ